MSAGYERGTRRRFVSVRAGTYPSPAALAAASAPRTDDERSAISGNSASLGDPRFEEGAIPFAGAASSNEAMRPAPPVRSLEEGSYEHLASPAFLTAEPEAFAEPAPLRMALPGPTAPGTLGILVGATIGAVVGIVFSTAMLALYAPTDFAQAILDPVALWTAIEDWKVLAGAILIAIGFVVLGAGQGAQRRAARA